VRCRRARGAPHALVRSYHKFQVDIALLRAMNVSNFRVSVAWSRVILSDGSVNQLGVQHYTDVFEVLAHNRLHAFVRAPQLLTSPCSL
jgi:beta-glucosidase/6-phospho-beta-glucosidase/beta-galactosidase